MPLMTMTTELVSVSRGSVRRRRSKCRQDYKKAKD